MSRLLIQPTVQTKWLEQHGNIEFELPEPEQRLFQALWQAYQQAGAESLSDFLNSPVAEDFYLYEQDIQFALLVGADYIQRRFGNFTQSFFQPNLIWRIE